MNKRFSSIFLALILSSSMLVSEARAVEQGEAPPRLSLTSATGESFGLDSLKGQVVYLDIWASWCGTCANSLAWMNELQQKYGKDQFKVVAVNVDENREDAERLLKSINLKMLVAFDPKGQIPSDLNIQAMPTSLLIDRTGKIISIHQGLKDEDRLKIEKMIEKEIKQYRAT